MTKIGAYFRLIRFTNLIIIILTQYFFRHFIIIPLYKQEHITPLLSEIQFLFIVLSTIFIAAGAYAINDYFDMRIDRINKPHKMILGKIIPRRIAILTHTVFTAIGILFSFMAAYTVGTWKICIVSIFIAFTLWMYSFRFKASFLKGNIIIAILSAMVVFIVWLFDFYAQVNSGQALIFGAKFLNGFMLTYVSFAFLTSLTREIIKDIEDIKGDEKVGCQTLPIVWGIDKAKWVTIGLTILNIILILIMVSVLTKYGIFKLLKYYLIIISFLFLYLIYLIRKSKEKEDFAFISNFIKIIIFAGLLSMQLIYVLFN
ncbi:MAG: geranylgeranylglycerol-phosphate geranylgeranyltransferase [Bacteroidales bacterium]|nr:geranylgeranylglycerol-phosphate geranylgeranyltransferase [Bacteroidales bacterium]